MKQPVKLHNNRIIGYIETKPNGDKVVTDFYNRQLGFYIKKFDRTEDFYHRVIGFGDLTGLLFNEVSR